MDTPAALPLPAPGTRHRRGTDGPGRRPDPSADIPVTQASADPAAATTATGRRVVHHPTADDRTSDRRPTEWLAMGAVLLVALVLNAWGLGRNGYGNTYYAAAARSMASNWRNFFFGAFDPGGFISVDKPPVALWFQALSVRAFGVSSWSLLLPGALAGTASVGLLWATLRRPFGAVAATAAALVLALSPVSVATNRLNMPEPYFILFLVGAAWAVTRSFDAPGRRATWLWLAAAGALIGLAFNTKMLGALIPTPAIGLAVAIGSPGRWRGRLARAAVVTAVALAVSASWTLIVDAVPASSRPYVGGSTDDTVSDLIFGYNGLGRVEGTGQGGAPAGGGAPARAGAPAGGFPGGGTAAGPGGASGTGGMSGIGGIFGGSPGATRLVSDAVGGQIAWFLPVALAGVALGAWQARRRRALVAQVVLWGGWLTIYGVIFSNARGTFHAYYTAAMAPAVAALVGVGAWALLGLVRRTRWLALVGAAVAVATLAMQLTLTGRVPAFYGWTRPLLVAGVLGGLAVLAIGLARRTWSARVLPAGLAVVMASLCIAPAAWAASETANPPSNATLPQAGPRGGVSAGTFGSHAFDPVEALATYLKAHRNGERWDLVVTSAQVASGYIAQDDLSVMALGGFMSTDAATTPRAFAAEVQAGEVRFVLTAGGTTGGSSGAAIGPRNQPGQRANGGFGGQPTASAAGGTSSVMSLVQRVCPVASGTDVPAAVQGSLHDCAGKGDALVAAAG